MHKECPFCGPRKELVIRELLDCWLLRDPSAPDGADVMVLTPKEPISQDLFLNRPQFRLRLWELMQDLRDQGKEFRLVFNVGHAAGQRHEHGYVAVIVPLRGFLLTGDWRGVERDPSIPEPIRVEEDAGEGDPGDDVRDAATTESESTPGEASDGASSGEEGVGDGSAEGDAGGEGEGSRPPA